MIELTKLNGSAFTLNAELIETLERAGKGTTVHLATNNRYNVLEPLDAVVEKVIEYRKRVSSESKAINPIAGYERQ